MMCPKLYEGTDNKWMMSSRNETTTLTDLMEEKIGLLKQQNKEIDQKCENI